jgi:hypothetical protein
VTPTDDTAVKKVALSTRTADAKRTMRAAGGALLEQARWQLDHNQRDTAIETVTRLLRDHPRSPIAPDAIDFRQRALLDRALDTHSIDDLQEVERGPYSYWVCAAKMTRASMMSRDGATAVAQTLMNDALTE